MKMNSASANKRPVYGLSQVSVYSEFQSLHNPWMKNFSRPGKHEMKDSEKETERSAENKMG